MTCVYCTTELPVDGNNRKIVCPKCGSEFYLTGHARLIPTDDMEFPQQLESDGNTESNRLPQSPVG